MQHWDRIRKSPPCNTCDLPPTCTRDLSQAFLELAEAELRKKTTGNASLQVRSSQEDRVTLRCAKGSAA